MHDILKIRATMQHSRQPQRPRFYMLRIAKALFIWGRAEEGRIALLKSALDKAVSGMIENQGKEITQGNVGDSSFQFSAGSMTVDLWVAALELAIRSIQSGKFEGRNSVRISFR